jgi:hypothetical protein
VTLLRALLVCLNTCVAQLLIKYYFFCGSISCTIVSRLVGHMQLQTQLVLPLSPGHQTSQPATRS